MAAGALLLMPRVYGDGHIAGTDTPGLLLWAATAVAFWNALHDQHRAWWRILVGVLVGLAFVEKMAAVAVILPLLAWLVVAHLPRTFNRRSGQAEWADGVTTIGGLAVADGPGAASKSSAWHACCRRPVRPTCSSTGPAAYWPGAILACPLAIWIVRRALFRLWRGHPVWGVERPALETWAAMLAFGPIVAWLGNPLWWRETLPRLAHYFMINAARRGVLPDIPIFYFGQTYFYSLPWHNAWVLMAITVPAGILLAALAGFAYALRVIRHDRIPVYFAVHLVTLPLIRMLGTPAHDGVRLFLPTFFFLAAMAGWGSVWLGDGLDRLIRQPTDCVALGPCDALVLGTSAWQLARIHPYELSYYNELIGGPRGAWQAGFELSYWYDAFNDRTIAEINDRLPRVRRSIFSIPWPRRKRLPNFKSLGVLRGDIKLGPRDPNDVSLRLGVDAGFDGDRVHEVAVCHEALVREPAAAAPGAPGRDGGRSCRRVARAGLSSSLSTPRRAARRNRPPRPGGSRRHAPRLAWFWGDGVPKSMRLNLYDRPLEWANRDPEGLRSAAKAVASRPDPTETTMPRGCWPSSSVMTHWIRPVNLPPSDCSVGDPRRCVEAVEILITRPRDVRTVLTRYPYTDEGMIGGFLDRGFP